MQGVDVIGLFCEDIREEKSGTDTLVGVMPDNVNVPSVPGMIPKLAFYIRVHVQKDVKIQSISAKVRLVDGMEQALGNFNSEAIEREQKIRTEKDAPISGFIFRGIVSPAPITGWGRILLLAKVDDEESICAALNLQKPD